MYANYRLKINGVIYNDSYIAKGSYKCEEARRVVRSWTDANGITHEEYAPTPKATISFAIREHDTNEHPALVTALSDYNDVTVEFYNDRTDSYRSGTFRIETIPFSHRNLEAGGILYNTTQIKLTER